MTSELVPRDPEPGPDFRISDTDRERAIEHLRGAVGLGRLTLDEFEQRIPAIYQARTRSELLPLVVDVVPVYAGREQAQLITKSGTLRRVGQWDVPRRLVVDVGSGTVKLDLTQAIITNPELRLEVTIRSGGVTLVVPEGTTANVDGVSIHSGTVKSQVPAVPFGSGQLHIHATGSLRSGMLQIRHLRRFWRWAW